MGKQKIWTGAELHRASALWKDGKTIVEVAAGVNRDPGSLKHQIASRRDLFPRRRQARHDLKEIVQLKFAISPFTHRLIKDEAKSRSISINMLIREVLRERFVKQLWKRQENASTAKVKYSNGSRE